MQNLYPRRSLPSLTAGAIASVLITVYAISLSALIFTGDLSEYVIQGTGLALFSAVAVNLMITIGGAMPGSVSNPQEAPAIIMALMVEAIARQMSPSSPEVLFTTVIATITITSLLTGLSCWVLGHFKAAEFVRFIPYPVIGGFLAGTGWLLTQGALSVMVGENFTLALLPQLLQPDRLLQWLPGVVLGVALLLLSRRFNHPLLIPGILLGAIALFYVTLGLTQTSIATARDAGLLLNVTASGGLWQPLPFNTLMQANWGAIWGTSNQMIAVILLTVLGFLLNATGLELVTGREINLNRELQTVGIGNIIGGAGGGMISFHGLGTSALNCVKLKANNRLTSLVVSLLCGVFLVVGATAVSLFPKAGLGGIALLLGLDFLVVWLYDAWSRMPRLDYSIIVLIMLMMGLVDVLMGIGLGIAVAMVLFVLNYSRIDVARYWLSGASYQSHTARSLHQTRLLQEKGNQTLILHLQGFLFFGTANRLLKQVQPRLISEDNQPLKFLVLNFRAVTGLDSSAVISFVKLRQLAELQRVRLIFVHLSSEIEHRLYQGGGLQKEDERCLVFTDLDRGVGWCEEQILAESNWRRQRSLPIALQLTKLLEEIDNAAELRRYLEKVQLDAGETIYQQGDAVEALYFIESGQVTVLMMETNQEHRLQSLGSGNVLGEMDFYRRGSYSTTAIAETPSTVYRLSKSSLQTLQQEDAPLATALQNFLTQVMSDRLFYAYRHIGDLMQ